MEILMLKSIRLIIPICLLCAASFAQNSRFNPDDGTPLLSASLNLQLARARVLEARPEAAADALRKAAEHLGAYEVLSPGPQAAAAEYIRRQILEQTARMNDDPYALCDRIVYLWLAPVESWSYHGGR
jgi:hypothetical protein